MPDLRSTFENPARDDGTTSLWKTLGSLQFKATALVVAVTLGVTWLACAYLLQGSVRVLRQHQEEYLGGVASVLARACEPLLEKPDAIALNTLTRDWLHRASLAYITITDARGRVLAQAVDESVWPARVERERSWTGLAGEPRSRPAGPSFPAVIEIARPIRGVRLVGGATEAPHPLSAYVVAAMPAQRWWPLLAEKLNTLIGLGLIGITVAVPLGFLVVRRIIAPLERLGVVMQRFSQGELSARSGVNRGDEIGALAAAFDRMADQHEQAVQRLVGLNEDLERRVEERTLQLRELAIRESLTGLYNRRHFNELLLRSFQEALRYGHELSCVMFDLDGFKEVNDLHGHLAGDEILVLLAETIRDQMRASDIPARFGGDEFIILLPQTDAERARVLAERIVRHFGSALGEREDGLDVGVSLGVASMRDSRAEVAEDLIRIADDRLLSAKSFLKSTA